MVSFLLVFMLATVSAADNFAHPVTQSDQIGKAVDLGEINKKAIKLPLVQYPRAARVAGIDGTVRVRVWFNQKGDVVRASVVAGPKQLRSVSLQSAKAAKFSANLGNCDSCRYFTGILVYTFVKQELSRAKA